MAKIIYVFTCVALALSSFLPSQEGAMSSKDERIHRILLGETDVIDEAVRTGDTSLIPAIRQRLNMETDQERRRYDQLALAKLRDRDTLQAVFCEIEEVAGVDTDGWRKLRYIGGGFSVRTLATLFDRDPEFGKILKKKKLSRQRGNDVLFLRPSEVALVLLPAFVSNPPWKGGYTLYGSKGASRGTPGVARVDQHSRDGN